MKNQLLFLFLFFGIAFQYTNAQSWAPVGAKWHFTKYFSNQTGVSFTTVEAIKDTTILGVSCRKVVGNISDCNWKTTYTYKSNDSVYFYHTDLNEFCLLYDFGASTGDTWEVLNITGGTPDTIILQVDSTDQIQVSGQNLKVLYTSMINNDGSSSSYFGGKIIENIGANMFTPSINFCSPPAGDLRCYSDNVLSYQTGLYSCEEVTVDLKEHFHRDISIYPNPLIDRDNLFVEFLGDYAIQNINGEILQKGRIENDKIHLIDIPKGTYFLILSNKNTRHKSKVIKL